MQEVTKRMADESKGVLGHLPPLPRKALNNSVIGMEQAYRQRKGLPLLSDTDIEALKAGEPMPWERGDGGSSTATTVATSVPAAPAESAPPAAASASAPASGVISEEVAKWVAEGKKWSKSAIADLLHFFPSATHLATSSLITPEAGAEAEAAAGGADSAGAAGTDVATVVA